MFVVEVHASIEIGRAGENHAIMVEINRGGANVSNSLRKPSKLYFSRYFSMEIFADGDAPRCRRRTLSVSLDFARGIL